MGASLEMRDGPARPIHPGSSERLALTGVFVRAALRYWLFIFPCVVSELRHWRRHAARIPDPALRQTALDALSKHGNMEGAAAFAAFVPRKYRGTVVRALVTFQLIYNHADMLAERPHVYPTGDVRSLHEALLIALDPGIARLDRHARDSHCDDAGYLAEILVSCHTALRELPSYATAAPSAHRFATRIVSFQSLSLGGREKLEHWARTQIPVGSGLEWWETAAAAGSSLGVHALIAAAAAPSLDAEDLTAIEDAYFPWIGALHSLLDSVIDEAEDAATGQLSLMACYPSLQDAAIRVRWLAVRALKVARGLRDGRRQRVLVVAMICSYISASEASAPGVDDLVRGVRAACGPLAHPMMLVFKMRQLTARLTRAFTGVTAAGQCLTTDGLGERKRGVDAGAA